MSRKRKAEGVLVDVPLPADFDTPTEFSIHFSPAEIRALSTGCVPPEIVETCVGLLEWLHDDPGPARDKIRPGSTMGERAKRTATGDHDAPTPTVAAADRPSERLV